MKFNFNSPLLSILLLLLLALSACDSKQKKEGPATINAEISQFPGKYLYLAEVSPDKFKPIDSIPVNQQGIYKFSVNLTSPGIYFLQGGPGRIILIVHPGSEISIKSSGDDMQGKVIITGSDESQRLNEYLMAFDNEKEVIGKLGLALEKGKERKDYSVLRDSIASVYRSLFETQRDLTIKYIKSNLSSLGSIIAINQRSGPNPVLDPVADIKIFASVDSSMMTNYKDNPHSLYFNKSLNEVKKKIAEKKLNDERLAPGKVAPNFTMSQGDGKNISLSDFLGSTVLIQFWGSWQEGQTNEWLALRKLHSETASKATFISIGLEHDEKQWTEVINKYKLSWFHLSDFKFDSSPVITMYNLGNQLPVYFIIAKDGTIYGRYSSVKEVEPDLKKLIKM